jgi:hypothetical protein
MEAEAGRGRIQGRGPDQVDTGASDLGRYRGPDRGQDLGQDLGQDAGAGPERGGHGGRFTLAE